jgi:hypothetical protein
LATVEAPRGAVTRPVAPVAAKRQVAVVGWAIAGAAFLAFGAYLMIRWVTGPYFKRVPGGPSAMPSWMEATTAGYTVFGCVAVVVAFYIFVARPKLRDGRLSTDSLLCLGFALIWWQDPLLNYSGNWFTYNSNLFNMGSWTHYVPGWLAPGAPGAVVAEPLLFTPALYVYGAFAASVIAGGVMNKVKARRPGISNLQLVAVCWIFIVTADIVLEGLVWMPLGLYTYAGGHGILNPSRFYKFPIEEALFFGTTWCGWACLRYFKDDRGHTLVERGVDALKVSNRMKTVVRFLALYGGINVIFIVGYNIPIQWVGTHSAPWPKDIQERSYLTNGLCGAGTSYACPGSQVPNARGTGSLHVGPDGRLVVPAGATPPTFVPFRDTKK